MAFHTHKIGNHCRTVHGMLRYYLTPFPYYMLGLSQQFPGAPPPCGLCHSQTCVMHEKVLRTWKPAIHNCHTHMRTGDTTYYVVSILLCRLSHTKKMNTQKEQPGCTRLQTTHQGPSTHTQLPLLHPGFRCHWWLLDAVHRRPGGSTRDTPTDSMALEHAEYHLTTSAARAAAKDPMLENHAAPAQPQTALCCAESWS
jgi:hypothetical protein